MSETRKPNRGKELRRRADWKSPREKSRMLANSYFRGGRATMAIDDQTKRPPKAKSLNLSPQISPQKPLNFSPMPAKRSVACHLVPIACDKSPRPTREKTSPCERREKPQNFSPSPQPPAFRPCSLANPPITIPPHRQQRMPRHGFDPH